MGCCVGVPVGPSSSRPEPRVKELETTASTCTTVAVRRRHVFEVKGHSSLLSRFKSYDSIQSAAFEVGGLEWAVIYYPYGCSDAWPGYASVFVELITPGAQARASCELSLVPWPSTAGGAPAARPVSATVAPRLFYDVFARSAGVGSFVKRKKLQAPPYLRDDTIRIECVVTVYKVPTASLPLPAPPKACALGEVPEEALRPDDGVADRKDI